MKSVSVEEMLIDDVLKGWAAWLMCGVGGSGLHPLAVLVRDNIEQPTRAGCANPLGDDEALKVDGFMAQLRASRPTEFNIAMDYYVYRVSYRVLGKRWRCSHQTICNRIQSVKSYLSGCLVGDTMPPFFDQRLSDAELADRLICELQLLLMASKADRIFSAMRKAG